MLDPLKKNSYPSNIDVPEVREKVWEIDLQKMQC